MLSSAILALLFLAQSGLDNRFNSLTLYYSLKPNPSSLLLDKAVGIRHTEAMDDMEYKELGQIFLVIIATLMFLIPFWLSPVLVKSTIGTLSFVIIFIGCSLAGASILIKINTDNMKKH